jgi:hypothetical protein
MHWWLGLGVGCNDFTLDPIDPEDSPPKNVVVRESFIQAPLPKVDLLLVIDDTASMAQEQSSLAEDFAILLDALDALAIGWQLGIVTTDMARADAGWLRGSPWILTPDLPFRDEIFAEMVQVGVTGGGPEAGLAAAALALDLSQPGEPNAGFRREDALLHVVFVSDADDQSDVWLGVDPAASFLGVLEQEIARTGLPARASALVGPLPSGCSSIGGTALPAERYDAVALASGGVVVSICAADFGPVVDTLSEASIVWRMDFPLRETPLAGSLRVEIDGSAIPEADFVLTGDVLSFPDPPPPESQIDVRYLVRLDSL